MGVYYAHYIIPRDNTHRPPPDRIAALIEAWLEAGFVPQPECETAATADLQVGQRNRPYYVLEDWQREALERPKSPKPPLKKASWWARLFGGAQPMQRSCSTLLSCGKPFASPPAGDSLAALGDRAVTVTWPILGSFGSAVAYIFEPVPPLQGRGPHQFWYDLNIDVSEDYRWNHANAYLNVSPIDSHCQCGEELVYEALALVDELRIRRFCPVCGVEFRPQDRMAEIANEITGEPEKIPGGVCYRFAIRVDCGKFYYISEEASGPRISGAFLDCCSKALATELYQVGVYT
jgi:hypothetical protein